MADRERSNRRILRTTRLNLVGATIVASFALGGCAFRSQVTGMAVDYNEFVAQTPTRQTVLTVLRAREREPMHFTSFSEVFGQVRGTGTASLGSALNGDTASTTATDTMVANTTAANAPNGGSLTQLRSHVENVGATNLTPQLQLQVTTGTDFRVAANATDEFYKGILNPVSANTIIHFLRQGFPADLLSHILIGRLEFSAVVTAPGGTKEIIPLKTIQNSPDEPIAAAEFAAAIRCRQLAYEMKTVDTKPLPIDTLSSLAPIAPDILKRLEASTDAAGAAHYTLTTPSQTVFTLFLAEPDRAECQTTHDMLMREMGRIVADRQLTPREPASSTLEASANRGGDRKSRALASAVSVTAGEGPGAAGDRERLGQLGEVSFHGADYFNEKLPLGYKGDLIVDITLRSVQGVLYYLGEYVRDEASSPKLAGGDCPGYCLPILRVQPIQDIPRTARFVEVSYRGARYAVPVSGRHLTPLAGRSSQTIDIVQQLLNLNRSAKDLPSTPLVRVAN